MSLEDVSVEFSPSGKQELVSEAFALRAVSEMEMALQLACRALPIMLDNHSNRCFVARRILARVGGGERSFSEMVCAGMAAIEQLRQLHEQV